ncbi:hypothetical protein MTR67_008783 [Solanum verrucosum]|uniref:Uncharacterized protein n=1 Tax=Solanum verrucosum TaxID=315347 RepID=A0AAF0TGQ3_SOLVR|nr:hypothetical protein MTR67_008783 [Solanum verrucosum]
MLFSTRVIKKHVLSCLYI